MAAIPELRGDRIVLNAHTDQDAAAHVAGEDEETARRFGWWPAQSTEQGVRAAYADWAGDWHDDGPRRAFAARDPDTGALVGGCELRIRPDGTAEVSYWTHAGQRGRGHARNALTLLAGYAASIGVTRLEARIAPGNHASRRVAEAVGFTEAGTVTDDGTEMIRYTRGPADALTARARELWESLAAAAAGFASVLSAAVSPRSQLCPPGWAGIVVLGDAALATAPDHGTARFIEEALGGVPVACLADGSVLRRLPGAEIRSPAALAYLDPAEFRAWPGDALTDPVSLDDRGFRQFVLAAGAEDVEESGISEITTPAFVVREHGRVVAAAGYREWPLSTAHLSVLTASAARGRGLARAAASAAVAHAIQAGRLPQWRARPQASRRVARALGFRELGFQVSLRLTAAVTSRELSQRDRAAPPSA